MIEVVKPEVCLMGTARKLDPFRVTSKQFDAFVLKVKEKTALFRLSARHTTHEEVEAALLQTYMDQIAPDLDLTVTEVGAYSAVYQRLHHECIDSTVLRHFDVDEDGGIVLALRS